MSDTTQNLIETSPWLNEPDKGDWLDDTTGLHCFIVRGPVGSLCGYVGVDSKHPWFKLSYSDEVDKPDNWNERKYDENRTPVIAMMCHGLVKDDAKCNIELALDVHGGVTFSNFIHKLRPFRAFAVENLWAFGFDCGHANDFSPGMPTSRQEGTYRTWDYVHTEVTGLAKQLAGVTK